MLFRIVDKIAILKKNKIKLRNDPKVRHLEEIIEDLKEEN